MPASSDHWSQVGKVALLIVIAVFLAYMPAVLSGFIWDDDNFVYSNPLILAADGLYRFWLTAEAPDYFPLTSSMLWVEWRLWGMNPAGYHVVNVALHAASSVLLWFVLRALSVPGAWLGALLFAVHPVCVESVAWITERKNTLSMMFYLFTFLLYIKYEKTGNSKWYGLSILAFLLSLLSKPAAVMLPVILLGIAWWRKGKVTREDILKTAPFFLLSLVLGLVTIWFQYHNAIEDAVVREDDLLSRLAIAGMAVWFYLYKAVLPLGLVFVYPRWSVNPYSAWSYLPLFLLASLFLLLWLRRQAWGRAPFFALICYVLCLLPVLGFFNIYFMRYSYVADHWQYHALPVLTAFIAAGVSARLEKSQFSGINRRLLLGGIVCVLLVLSFNQARIYKDSETLWLSTLESNPAASIARNNLAKIHMSRNRLGEAMVQLRKALDHDPDFEDALVNMGCVLEATGRFDEAIGHYDEVLKRRPDIVNAHFNMASLLLRKGRFEEAEEHFGKAADLRPDYAMAKFNLGTLYARTGRLEQAAAMHREVLKIEPENVAAHNGLGAVLAMNGEHEEARKHFQAALRLDPNNPHARRFLSAVTGAH